MLLQTLHLADVVAFYDTFIAPEAAAMVAVHVHGRAFVDAIGENDDNAISSVAAFKASKTLFPRPSINPHGQVTFEKTAVKCWAA